MLQIRRANYNDLNSINILLNKLIEFESVYNENIDTNFNSKLYYKQLNQKGCITYIACYNGIYVGYINGYITEYQNSIVKKSVALIDSIFIIEEYRNMGIGTKLIEEFKNWAINMNVGYIEIMVLNDNVGAKSLYEKIGFKNYVSKMQLKL